MDEGGTRHPAPRAELVLQSTVRKLQSQLEDQKGDGRLERYRKLQKDLEECDKVRDSLRHALLAWWTEEEIDAHVQKKLFKASTLYGSSREMLLKENRLLRAQLEEHLVTSRTSRPAGGRSPGGPVPESKLKQARMMQGPHMESVSRLLEASDTLDQAERGYKLPTVAHVETEARGAADDGSLKLIATLQQQVAVLAGQKLQLIQQVAALTDENRILDMKLDAANDQARGGGSGSQERGRRVVDLRRQKTEMLAHQDNLSKDLRDHLLSEAKRADAAELGLAEAKQALDRAREAEEAARQRMERALAEAHAAQAALAEKTNQVEVLKGLYTELREALEQLAGDVTSGQQDTARRLLEATDAHFNQQRVLIEGTHRAAKHGADVVTDLTQVQRALVDEVAAARENTADTLNAFERQLAATQQLLAQSEADRVRLARQALAASALNRVEDKRHEKTVKLLLEEVPRQVADKLAPELKALREGTMQVADEVDKQHEAFAKAGITVKGAAADQLLHAPMVPDLADDQTSRVINQSKLLRTQLHTLAAGAPHPGPAQPGQALAPPGSHHAGPYVASLFRGLPPGMQPLGMQALLPLQPLPDPTGPEAAAFAQPGYEPAHPPVSGPGEIAVAWLPPGVVPSSTGSPQPVFPGGPSYLTSAPRQYAQPQLGPGPGPVVMFEQPPLQVVPAEFLMAAPPGASMPYIAVQPPHERHVDLVLQVEHAPGALERKQRAAAERAAERLIRAGEGPPGPRRVTAWEPVRASSPPPPPPYPVEASPQGGDRVQPLPGSEWQPSPALVMPPWTSGANSASLATPVPPHATGLATPLGQVTPPASVLGMPTSKTPAATVQGAAQRLGGVTPPPATPTRHGHAGQAEPPGARTPERGALRPPSRTPSGLHLRPSDVPGSAAPAGGRGAMTPPRAPPAGSQTPQDLTLAAGVGLPQGPASGPPSRALSASDARPFSGFGPAPPLDSTAAMVPSRANSERRAGPHSPIAPAQPLNAPPSGAPGGTPAAAVSTMANAAGASGGAAPGVGSLGPSQGSRPPSVSGQAPGSSPAGPGDAARPGSVPVSRATSFRSAAPGAAAGAAPGQPPQQPWGPGPVQGATTTMTMSPLQQPPVVAAQGMGVTGAPAATAPVGGTLGQPAAGAVGVQPAITATQASGLAGAPQAGPGAALPSISEIEPAEEEEPVDLRASATVWVPHPALIQAFKDKQLI
ncbi:hypothetical protein HYH03_009379 [Edaphochlamys debaryana]|uniref:Uncharacterized protein n=1 Tax=Edaphochlamys debaryana TaxID=47281 RepID=A0A835XYB7_9CHLO|nr:hypothetical protein HYH03_009379 [Edaphochlamys debaryana]|eukprot:KAG2492436.1 hypothetical protein HYH03_009379 [Edaphochlamys debaryana]